MNEFARRSLQKRLNYVKLIFLFLDVGANVLVRAFELLYKGTKPAETHLAALSKVKSNSFFPVERETLEMLRDGEIQLRSLDTTLLYKLIQVSCGLIDKTTREGKLLWSKNCPEEKRDSLEFLLFRYKDARNEIIHDFRKLEALTDNSFNDIKINSESILLNIINEVGKHAKLCPKETNEWQRKICEDMNFICQWNLRDEEFATKSLERNFSKEEERECPEGSFESDIMTDEGYRSTNNFGDRRSRNVIIQGGASRNAISAPKSNSYLVENFSDLARKGMNTIKGYTIKRDILDQYGGEILTKFSDWQMDNAYHYAKCDRNFWINRLLTTNILEDDATLQQFLKEYSMEQMEKNWISNILYYFKAKFGL